MTHFKTVPKCVKIETNHPRPKRVKIETNHPRPQMCQLSLVKFKIYDIIKITNLTTINGILSWKD